ncbi:MAG: glyceraldehyde-3-phosphate dehydrogenase, partial [Bacteroidota bacterium]
MSLEAPQVSVNFKDKYEHELADWIEMEKSAINLIQLTGTLWFDRSVELVLFRNQLVDRSASEILHLHQYAKEVVKKSISIHDTVALAEQLLKMDLAPSRIDIGRLNYEWTTERSKYKDIADFAINKLGGFMGKEKKSIIPRDVVL